MPLGVLHVDDSVEEQAHVALLIGELAKSTVTSWKEMNLDSKEMARKQQKNRII